MRRLALIGAAVVLVGAIAAGVGGMVIWHNIEASLPPLPDPKAIATSTIVVDRDGKLLRPFTIADGRWRLPVTRDDVDAKFLKMLIGYEDQHFYAHGGVDPLALVRAAGQFVLAGGHIVSGGSTLTMQVARLIAGDSTRSVVGKLQQIALAEKLEARFSKDEILDLYLLLAPYGGNIEGVRAASLAYFGKEPKRLTTAQAALLVALPQSPEARRPDRDADAARAARDRVLDRLVAEGVTDPGAAEAALSERVPVARKPFPLLAPHLALQAVAAEPGAAVHRLTVDRDLQASLERLAADRIAGLGPKLSIAIVVADEVSGDILASVGSAGLFEEQRDGHVDMTRAVRSPGSTLKPLIYGLAFEQGLALPETLIEDRPTGFGSYAPKNFDGFHRGTVTVREALQQSLNVPAIVALNAVGPARLVARLKRAAVNAALPDESAPGLAIGLGGVGVTLRDLVSLYAAIARGGTAIALNDGVGDAGAGARRSAGARPDRCLVRLRHPLRRAAAAQRLARPHRLQDRHLVRLSRRLGDRLRRRPRGRRLGRPAGRHAGAGPRRHRQRRAHPVRGLRSHRCEARGAQAGAAGRADGVVDGGPAGAAAHLPRSRPGDLRAEEGRPGNCLSARWRRGRSRHRRRRSHAAGHQGPQRRAALHLVRQRQPHRAHALCPLRDVEAGRARLRHPLGGRP